MENLNKLVYWIREREAIRKRKEAGESKPWSADSVFQTVYFCNVHREDDRVTKFIRAYYDDFYWHSKLIPNLMVARMFNWPQTIGDLGFLLPIYARQMILTVGQKRAAEKKKVWGGAYVITTHGRKMSKLEYCAEVLEIALKDEWDEDFPTLEALHQRVMNYEGFGSFLAAQVVADVKNTKGHPLGNAPDWDTFVAHGPGSLRGIAWVYGYTVSPRQFPEKIGELHDAIQHHEGVPGMCRQDLQNCLCEFDKYMRVSTGKGKSKRLYNGKEN